MHVCMYACSLCMCGVYVFEVCMWGMFVTAARPGVAWSGVAGCVTRPAVSCPNPWVPASNAGWPTYATADDQPTHTSTYICKHTKNEKYTNTSTHMYTYRHSHASLNSNQPNYQTNKQSIKQSSNLQNKQSIKKTMYKHNKKKINKTVCACKICP